MNQATSPMPPLARRFASAEEALGTLRPLKLSPDAERVVAGHGGDLLAAVRALGSEGLVDDAVGVLGLALERRAAAWWACAAARREPAAIGAGPGAEGVGAEERALDAAEAWVRHPDAVKADAARAAAESVEAASPATCAALAAFLAGDSLAPPGGTAVPPAEHLAGIAAAGAVRMAAVRGRPDIAGQTLRNFLDLGLAIAAGRESWDTHGSKAGT